ncbi:MAG: D-alanyl-D-alanine carboxypeptidase family protein [Bosea sp. (in: a-proteobacteria)]
MLIALKLRTGRLALALACLFALSFACLPTKAQNFTSSAPHAILLDTASGTVLYEKAADTLMVPASMAKIATALVVFEEMAKGRLKPDDDITISDNAWRKGGAPAGGSAMFAQLGSKIKLSDVLQGLIVQSGNDAAIAVAEAIAGTEQNFARMMTDRVRALGLTQSTFRNATGMGDPEQRVTARDMAKLSAHIIATYPEPYKLFGQREFTWNKVRQQNRNPLLTMDIGADGIKTGMLGESGFGLVGSAVQNGQRLIVVVNGLPTARDRAVEARKLLEWGFRSFEERALFKDGESIGEAKIYGGAASTVPLKAKSEIRLLLPRGSSERINARIVYQGPLKAPVEAGKQVGTLFVTRGDVKALEVPLFAAASVAEGTLQQKAWDAILEGAIGSIRKAFGRS